MKKNIFPAKSQSIQELFSDAPSLETILIVPVDYAKKSHTVQFCLGTGDLLLKKALTIYNTPAGLDYFLKRIDKISSRYHIKRENVLIVSEEPPAYLINFIYSARARGFLWARVNPFEAKKFRQTLRASSDIIDLTGIAGAAINRKAVLVKHSTRYTQISNRLLAHAENLYHQRLHVKTESTIVLICCSLVF